MELLVNLVAAAPPLAFINYAIHRLSSGFLLYPAFSIKISPARHETFPPFFLQSA